MVRPIKLTYNMYTYQRRHKFVAELSEFPFEAVKQSSYYYLSTEIRTWSSLMHADYNAYAHLDNASHVQHGNDSAIICMHVRTYT
jgi:hypothetical protein